VITLQAEFDQQADEPVPILSFTVHTTEGLDYQLIINISYRKIAHLIAVCHY